MNLEKPLLFTENLEIGYNFGRLKTKVIAGPVKLNIYAGQVTCLIGPNGCGKSTLLRTLSGLQACLNGEVFLQKSDAISASPDKMNLHDMARRDLARQISLVLTDNVRSGNLDVRSLVALGRYPYSGWLGRLNDYDNKAINDAIDATGIRSFLNRKIDSLSDGECQKVMLARAIAQDTPIIFLDEPTAHLDLPSRIQLMELLHKLAKTTDKAILLSTHELDLALQVADQMWMMSADGKIASGIPEVLVLNGAFQRAFDKDAINFNVETGTFQIQQTGLIEISIEGDGATAFWTKKALVRLGFTIVNHQTDTKMELRFTDQGMRWIIRQTGAPEKVFDSLEQALEFLKDIMPGNG